MATSATEFKGVRPEHTEILREALEQLRERIALSMARLGYAHDDPRWVESNLRLSVEYASPDFIANAPDARIDADVLHAIDCISRNYSSSFWEARAELFKIPAYAYVDVFKRLGIA